MRDARRALGVEVMAPRDVCVVGWIEVARDEDGPHATDLAAAEAVCKAARSKVAPLFVYELTPPLVADDDFPTFVWSDDPLVPSVECIGVLVPAGAALRAGIITPAQHERAITRGW